MTDWYWHIHHEIIGEPLTEPLQNRLDYIAKYKPEPERELRLRLIAPVTAPEPEEVVKAWAAYVTARAAYDKAWAAYVTARADWLTSIHDTDCPAAIAGTCPWNEHPGSIFE
jgi:hypothetical protein